MANIVFPNDLNSAPLCTVCEHKVVDDGTRSITKLICGHYFHADCIAVEFNFMGLMKCPNCEVVEEDGLWMKFADFEDGESSDEDEDEQSSEVDQNNEHHDMNPLHATNGAQNGGVSPMRGRQQSHVPPPPDAIEMIEQRICVSCLNNIDSDTAIRNDMLPTFELITLENTSSSVSDASSSKTH